MHQVQYHHVVVTLHQKGTQSGDNALQQTTAGCYIALLCAVQLHGF